MRYTVEFHDDLPRIDAEVDGDFATFEEAVVVARLNVEDLYRERIELAKSDYEDGIEYLDNLEKPKGWLRLGRDVGLN